MNAPWVWQPWEIILVSIGILLAVLIAILQSMEPKVPKRKRRR